MGLKITEHSALATALRGRADTKRRWVQRGDGSLTRTQVKEARCAERLGVIAEVKQALGCSICGYNRHPVALDIHHVDRVRGHRCSLRHVLGRWSWDRIISEMEGCVVLCANCHRAQTEEERQHERSPSVTH